MKFGRVLLNWEREMKTNQNPTKDEVLNIFSVVSLVHCTHPIAGHLDLPRHGEAGLAPSGRAGGCLWRGQPAGAAACLQLRSAREIRVRPPRAPYPDAYALTQAMNA